MVSTSNHSLNVSFLLLLNAPLHSLSLIPHLLLKETVPCYSCLSGSAAYCLQQVEGCGAGVARDFGVSFCACM